MFRFTIRDVLWLTVVVALAVMVAVERRTHRKETETLKASHEQTSIEREGFRWQLMHATDELESQGFIWKSDDKQFELVGPFSQGYDRVRITRIKNGELLKIMSGDKDVTRNFISPGVSGGASQTVSDGGGDK